MSFPERLLQRRKPLPLWGCYGSDAEKCIRETRCLEADVTNRSNPSRMSTPNVNNDIQFTMTEQLHYYLRDNSERTLAAGDEVRSTGRSERGHFDKRILWDFLRFNRSVVEEFVIQEVPQESLERWLIRKTALSTATEGNESPLSKWKFCVHSDKRQLLSALLQKIQRSIDNRPVLFELCSAITNAVQASEFVFFILDTQTASRDLVEYTTETSTQTLLRCSVKEGDTIPGYVAFTMNAVKINILEERKDPRFKNGALLHGLASCAVVCVPITSSSGQLQGVLELARKASEPEFSHEDMEIISSYLTWAAVALELTPCEGNLTYSQQRMVTQHILKLIRIMADGFESTDIAYAAIKDSVKVMTGAEQVALFAVNHSTSELYACMLSLTSEQQVQPVIESKIELVNNIGELHETEHEMVVHKGQVVRFPISSGAAGLSVRAKKSLVINDPIECEKLQRILHSITGYAFRSVLSVPLISCGKVIGVLEAWNKMRSSGFVQEDRTYMETLSHICTLVLLHHQLCRESTRLSLHWKVEQGVLSQHRSCTEEEFQRTKCIGPCFKGDLPLLNSFSMDTAVIAFDQSPHVVQLMLSELTNLSSYDKNTLLRFILTVRRCYRSHKYHNWQHALCVAHCAYVAFHSEKMNRFTELEKMSLFIACLCHDLEHPGYSNSFLKQTKNPLALLYPNSELENHHVMQTLAILKNENIFGHLQEDQHKKVLEIIKAAILATDIALAPHNIKALRESVDMGRFSWQNHQNRQLLHSILITTCDVCATCKPWEINRRIIDDLYCEFYQQGNEEKELGFTPSENMDSNKKVQLTELQVNFLSNITLPCCELLSTLLPNTRPLLEGALKNLHQWRSLDLTR